MSYIQARNRINGHVYANYEVFESWRQLVEVMLHCLVHSDMKKELKVAVLFELIQDLLLKVVGWAIDVIQRMMSPGIFHTIS